MSASPVTLEQTRCYEKPNRFYRPKSYIFSPRSAKFQDRCVFYNLNFARHYATAEDDAEERQAQPKSRPHRSIFADYKCVDTSLFVAKAHSTKQEPRPAALSCLSQYERMECSSLWQPRGVDKQSLYDLLTQSISAFAEPNSTSALYIRPLSRPRLNSSSNFTMPIVYDRYKAEPTLADGQGLESAACQPFSDSELSDILCVNIQKKTIRPPPTIKSRFVEEYTAEQNRQSTAELPRPELQPRRPVRLSGEMQKENTRSTATKSQDSSTVFAVQKQHIEEKVVERQQQQDYNYLKVQANYIEPEIRDTLNAAENVYATPEAYPGFDHSLQSLDGSDLCMLLNASGLGYNATIPAQEMVRASLSELRQQLSRIENLLNKLKRKTFMSKQDDIDFKKYSIKARTLESEIAKRRRENGEEARKRVQGAAPPSNGGIQQISRFIANKKHRAPERRGNYVYRVLDTVLDSVQIIARTDLQTQQTKYFRVPRLKFVELIQQGLFYKGVEYSALQSRECIVQAQVESNANSFPKSQCRY